MRKKRGGEEGVAVAGGVHVQSPCPAARSSAPSTIQLHQRLLTTLSVAASTTKDMTGSDEGGVRAMVFM